MAVIPALAGALEADPAFAVLAAHKAAWARPLETENRTDDYDALEAAGRAVDAALEVITSTPPRTRAGTRAVIENLIEWEKDGARETSGQYLLTLLRSPLLAAV